MSSSKRPPVALGEWQVQDSTTKLAASDGHVPRAWLVELAEGDMPEQQRELVMAHVVECAECRKVWDELGSDATVRFDPNVAVRPPKNDHESLIGTMLGEYRVEAVLDEGAMGVVYRGVHPLIGKAVAIKVMQRDFARDPENNHRLITEARAVNAIGHPNIVDVFSFGTLPDGRQYLVMELLTGKNLRVLGREAPISTADGLDILLQVAAALAAAHKTGVVHRDLKPSNIFISRHLGALHVTVLDFGVAKALNRNISDVATTPGMMIGTAGFMAPEQILGQEVGGPADVYALGCVAYWLFSRDEVFSPKTIDELYRLHIEASPPPLSTRVRVSPGLDALVGAMLQKNAALRPTAADVQQRAQRLIGEARPMRSMDDDVPTQPPMAPIRATPLRMETTVPVEPVLSAPTLPETPMAKVPRPVTNTASVSVTPVSPIAPVSAEDTLRPRKPQTTRITWFLVAALAASVIVYVLVQMVLPRLRG